MKREIIKKIQDSLKAGQSISLDDKININKKGYESINLSKKNFHAIRREASSKKIAYIDGGQATLYKTSALSIHFIRTCGIIMQGTETTEQKKAEFFVLVKTVYKDNKLIYVTEIIPTLGTPPKKISIDSTDARIMSNGERGSPGALAGILRKMSELGLATLLCGSLDTGDIMLLDGTLEAKWFFEQEKYDELFKLGDSHDILIGSVAKSTNMITKNGASLVYYLEKIAPGCAWYYYPALNIDSQMHKANVFFSKLHKNSEHILMIEIYKNQALVDNSKLFGILASVSLDIVIPGYPYGLMKVDKLARISESEKHYLKARILLDEKSATLHEKLDSVY